MSHRLSASPDTCRWGYFDASVPPALTIFSLIASGVILGPMGVILAVPLTVVAQTLVKQLVNYGPEDVAKG